MKAETDITCNNCPKLEIFKRQIKDEIGRIDRNTWRLTCGRLIIGLIEVNNTDLHGKNMPEIKAPWDCEKRQELRKQGIESKFELQIG